MSAIEHQTSDDKIAIRSFEVNVPETKIAKLRSRKDATEWPDRETVADESQGVQLATMQKLARYWATDYDWRKCEPKLNSLPNFMTDIDGLDIHFIRNMKMRCRSSSRTGGRARPSELPLYFLNHSIFKTS